MNARPTIYSGLDGPLPIEVGKIHAPGSWGMLLLIATDAAVFACLLASYFYLQAGKPEWPPDGIKKPDLSLISINTLILWGSSIPIQWADSSIRKGHRGRLAIGYAIGFCMGVLFVILQGVEYSHKSFSPQSNAYGSLFFTITGFHGVHVIAAAMMNGVIQVRAWLGHFDEHRHLAVRNVSIFWHFVDFMWVFIFASLYLSP
jgi:cytochrome c oxidase subunit 3/cytochrome c oxidase subunit I+III